ncbi:NADP-dependent oxidoreductase domain-containing protein [Morchella snyderi]|nr:NADP-dependent oxidoreductase domain-containing protein [Morchella snyderi]
MSVPSSFKLNTGASIPSIGLGTWQAPAGEVQKAVAYALLKAGYTHIDCAWCYGNEEEVGTGLKEAFDNGIKREDIFITTKVWSTYHSRVEEALDKSLKLLGLDYVDLYLMHWPVPLNPNGNHDKFPVKPDGGRDLQEGWDYIKTWKLMEKLLEGGKVKAIGVSNHSVPFLTKLLKETTIVPAVNQIENHPLLPQDDVVALCKENRILVTAYSPLGSIGGPLLKEEKVLKVAEKHGVDVGTVLLNYHVNRGIAVLAKSVTPSRIEANNKLLKLDEDDLEVLESIYKEKGPKRFITPPWPINFGFPDWKQGGANIFESA